MSDEKNQKLVLNTGEIIYAYSIKLSKTRKSYVALLRKCTCYRNTCDCVIQKTYPKEEVYSINDKIIEKEPPKPKYNLEDQYYRGLPLRLINRQDYKFKNAKRYVINNTNQNIWIPNTYLLEDGTIKPGVDIMFIFKKAQRQLELAGYKLKY